MKYKEGYDNKIYSIIIRKNLENKNMNPMMRKVVEEIFLRRAHELEQTHEEFEEGFENFINNIDTIRFAEEKEFNNCGNAGKAFAHCDYNKKEICINKDVAINRYKLYKRYGMLDEFYDNLFSAVAHEVEHGTEAVNGYKLGYNEKGVFKGAALSEIFTERVAHACTKKMEKTKNIVEYLPKTNGYHEITFVASLLATTFNVPEKELLKASTKGREKFISTLLGHQPMITYISDEQDLESVCGIGLENFFGIEKNLNRLYNANYKDNKLDEKAEKGLKTNALSGIYRYAISELDRRAAIVECMNVNNIKKHITDLTYRKARLDKIMDVALKDEMGNNAKWGVGEASKNLNKKLDNMHSEWCKQKYGIEISKYSSDNRMDRDIEYEENIIKKEYNNFEEWNNFEVSNNLENVFENDVIIPNENIAGKIRRSISQFFTRLFKGNIKMLSPPSTENPGSASRGETVNINEIENGLAKYEIKKIPAVDLNKTIRTNEVTRDFNKTIRTNEQMEKFKKSIKTNENDDEGR